MKNVGGFYTYIKLMGTSVVLDAFSFHRIDKNS